MNRATTVAQSATLDDLMRTSGKAELIGGRIIPLTATGHRPNRIAARIFRSLDDHAEAIGQGVAYTDNMGFAVEELGSGRQSFSPDAAYYRGPLPDDEMNIVNGPPTLAVEVRSKSDYGPSAELEMSAKRADYFEAGTAIVWDVEPQAEVVRSFLVAMPEQPLIFSLGQIAHAETAIPGWQLAVDRIFS